MNHTHNIFISSTFQDMHAERDLLHNVVIPELLSRFSKYHIRLDLIDLRWGIDTADDGSEQENTNKILRVCFDEIERSRPFFIGFIGERYGWIPKSEDIESAVLGYGMDFSPEDACSITELEMRYAMQQFAPDEHCFFLIRNGLSPDDIEDETLRAVYFPQDGALKERCDRLKHYLRSSYPDQTFDYQCCWDQSTGRVGGLDGLCDLLIERLSGIICAELMPLRATQDTGIFAQEQVLQQAIAEQLCDNIYGRDVQLELLRQFVLDSDPDRRELAVIAPSGLGKSSLMAKFHQSLAHEDMVVIPFFAGSSEKTRDFRFLARYCCQYLHPVNESTLLQLDYPALKKHLLAALVDAAEEKTVVILVDALDQFADSKELRQLDWIHDQLIPKGVKVIYSCLPGREDIFRKRSTEIYRLEALTPEAVKLAAAGIAQTLHKELWEDALSLLADKQDYLGNRVCCVPIYLVSMMELLCSFDSDDFARIAAAQESRQITAAAAIRQYVADTICGVGCDIDDVIMALTEKSIRQLGRKYDIISALLVSSPGGITERELYGITAAGNTPITPADFSIYRRMFRMHLQQREDGCWSFSHAIIRNAILHQSQKADHRTLWEQAAAWYITLPADDPKRCAGIIRYMGKCENYAGIAASCNESIDPAGAAVLYALAEEINTPVLGKHPLLAAFDAQGRLNICRSLLTYMQSLGKEDERLVELCCSCIAALQQDDLKHTERIVLLSEFYCFSGLLLLHENDHHARSFFELSLNILLQTDGIDPKYAAEQALRISRIFSARQDRMVSEQYALAALRQARRCADPANELLAETGFELGTCILANPLSTNRFRAGQYLWQALQLADAAGKKDLAARAAVAYMNAAFLPRKQPHRDAAARILRGIRAGEVTAQTQVELQLYLAEGYENNATEEVLHHCRSAYEAAIDGLAQDNSDTAMELYEKAAEQYGYSLMLHKDPRALEIMGNAERICRKLSVVTNDSLWDDRRISIREDLAAFCRAGALPLPAESSVENHTKKQAAGNREALQKKNIYRSTAGRIGSVVFIAYAVAMILISSMEFAASGAEIDLPLFVSAVSMDLLMVVINVLLVVTMNYLALMVRNLDKGTLDHRLNGLLLTRNIVLNGVLIALCCAGTVVYCTKGDIPYYYDQYYGAIVNTQVLFYVFSGGFTWFISYVASGFMERAGSSGLRQSARFVYRRQEVLNVHKKMCLFAGIGILFFLPCIGVPTMDHYFLYLSAWNTRVPDYIPFCWLPLAIQVCFSLLELHAGKKRCGSTEGFTPAPVKQKPHPAFVSGPVMALAVSAVVIVGTAFFMEPVAKQYQYLSYGYGVEDGFFYQYREEGDGVYVYHYYSESDDENVVIPPYLDGKRVMAITSGAFDYTGISSISLPSGVTEIPEYAFRGCTSLQNVRFSNTLRTIGKGAFENCASLRSVRLPASVELIGEEAFLGCFALEEVTAPDDLPVVIEKNAFLDSGLEFLPQTQTLGYYTVANQIVCGNKHHHGPLVITEGVTGIADNVFQNAVGITELYLPDSLTAIGTSAFSGCSSLYYVYLGESLADIGNNAFLNCEKLLLADNASQLDFDDYNYGSLKDHILYLSDLSTGDSVLPKRTEDGLLFLYDQAQGLYYLLSADETQREMTLPADYQGNAFSNRNVFTPYAKCLQLFLAESDMTYWGGYNGAVTGNPAPFPLAEVLPVGTDGTLISNGQGLLYCENPADGSIWILGHTGKQAELVIDFPESTPVKIHPYAFRADPTISSVTVSGNVSIPENAFESCINLTAFSAGGKLSLGARAFMNCRSLESVTLDADIEELPSELFYNCISLKEFSAPETLTIVGSECFYNCIDLQRINAQSVESLGDRSFYNCFSLKDVSFGQALESIDSDTFVYCFGLQQIHYSGTVSQWSQILFENEASSPFYDANDAKLIVNGAPVTVAEFDASVENIQSYSFYGYGALEKVVFPQRIRSTGQMTFAYCYNLKQVTIPDTLMALDHGVFMGCTGLTQIDLANVTTLGDSAFNGCTNLETVTGLDHLRHIGFKTFSKCERLRNLTFGEDLHTVETFAFQYCTGLESVRLPDSVESMGDNLFTGCTKLTLLELPKAWESSTARILGNCVPEQVIYY